MYYLSTQSGTENFDLIKMVSAFWDQRGKHNQITKRCKSWNIKTEHFPIQMNQAEHKMLNTSEQLMATACCLFCEYTTWFTRVGLAETAAARQPSWRYF